MTNGKEELIGPFNVLHDEERSRIVVIDQDGVIKRYSTSLIIIFLEQLSILDDFITELQIEVRHVKVGRKSDEPEFYGVDLQLNVYQ